MSGRTYSRADVATHYDHGRYHALPAVNIRVTWRPDPFTPELLRSVAAEAGELAADFVAWWQGLDEDRRDDLVYGRDGYGWSYFAAEDGFELARELADEVFPQAVKVWQEGRSGGWLVVDGLPYLDEWDAVALGRWRRFARGVADLVADHPYRVAMLACCNTYRHEREQAEAVAASTTASTLAASWAVPA